MPITTQADIDAITARFPDAKEKAALKRLSFDKWTTTIDATAGNNHAVRVRGGANPISTPAEELADRVKAARDYIDAHPEIMASQRSWRLRRDSPRAQRRLLRTEYGKTLRGEPGAMSPDQIVNLSKAHETIHPGATAPTAASPGLFRRWGRRSLWGALAVGTVTAGVVIYEHLPSLHAQPTSTASSAASPNLIDAPKAGEAAQQFATRLNTQIGQTGSVRVKDPAGGVGYFEITKNGDQYSLFRLNANGARMDGNKPLFAPTDNKYFVGSIAGAVMDPNHTLSQYAQNPEAHLDYKAKVDEAFAKKAAALSQPGRPTAVAANRMAPGSALAT